MGSAPGRGPADYWSPGDWNIICSICGTKLKFSQAVRNWQGMWRHPKCDEPRHPQDFVHSISSQEMAIPYPQYMAEQDIQICTWEGISAVPDYGMPGCMIPGRGGMPLPSPPICTVNGRSAIPGFAIGGCMIPGNRIASIS